MIDWELLLAVAIRLGWSPAEFWAASFAELTLAMANDIAQRAPRVETNSEAALDRFFAGI